MISFRKLKQCFIVAEVSANHGQDFKRAVALIQAAKKCGADAVKFQTFTPETMTLDVNNKYFRVDHPRWGGQTLYQLYKKAYAPWAWFKKLKKVADDAGIIFFSTAFDKSSVDFLQDLKVPFHKVASFELVDLPLIQYIAHTKKPLILSTGMATLGEIKKAVTAARKAGVKDLVLLKCLSVYPAEPEHMNLRTIPHMSKLFCCPVGFSDHSLSITMPVAAVCMGAVMVEKHFTLSRKNKTPDYFFSLEPQEFKELVKNIRDAQKALGRIRYGLTGAERKSRVFRRSLFAVEDIKKGQVFSEKNIKSLRPAYGLPPRYYKEVLGKKASCAIKKGTPIKRRFVFNI